MNKKPSHIIFFETGVPNQNSIFRKESNAYSDNIHSYLFHDLDFMEL